MSHAVVCRASLPCITPRTKAGCTLLHPGYPFSPFTPFPSVLKAGEYSNAGTERAWLVTALVAVLYLDVYQNIPGQCFFWVRYPQNAL